jgi:arylsulfatase A-like enzyme
MADDTLVIFTADNGASPNAARTAMERGHEPCRPLRGMKSDIWDGGHRVPFIAWWPGHVPGGTVCDDTICLNDLLATLAAMHGEKLPDDAGEDSYNMLPQLLGREADEDVRQEVIHFQEATVHHSVFGYFAIRRGKWKLCLCAGSGGWGSRPRTKEALEKGMPSVQLYNMEEDLDEQNNLYKEHPEVVEELKSLLTEYIKKGRSTPGKPQQNWKGKNSWEEVNWL